MEMEFRTLEDYIPQKEMGKVFHPPEVELKSAYTNYREAKVSNVTAYPRTTSPRIIRVWITFLASPSASSVY